MDFSNGLTGWNTTRNVVWDPAGYANLTAPATISRTVKLVSRSAACPKVLVKTSVRMKFVQLEGAANPDSMTSEFRTTNRVLTQAPFEVSHRDTEVLTTDWITISDTDSTRPLNPGTSADYTVVVSVRNNPFVVNTRNSYGSADGFTLDCIKFPG
jgi:hypothetical protein